MDKKIGEDLRKIVKEKEAKPINFKPVNFDKLNKKLNRKPIRWFWKHWRWREFWYSYTWNGIIGPGSRSRAHLDPYGEEDWEE